MGYTCEYCGEQRSIVYCRSDAACLCLSCDRNVHSANALSQRHSRTLVCERCNSQPAIFRCVEESVSLCQNCDWVGHATSSTGLSTHKRQPLSCYTGCPSAVELSTIWSFLLDDPSVGDSTCEQGMGSMCITDSQPGVRQGSQAVEANDLQIPNEKSTLLIESSMPSFDNKLHDVELPVGSTDLTWSKVSNFGTKGSNLFEDDPFYVDFNMDEVDLSIENYEELFGVPLDDPAQLFENESIDALFGMKDTSVADSTCHDVNVVQGSVVKSMQPACSNAASVESMRSCKTEPPTLCFARAAHSSLSFSNVTGESSAGDYQDCGASSMFQMGEPPWCPPCSETSMPSTSRTDAVLRYKAKKKSRQFEKRVRYVSRKERADVRRRVKGRFVKAGDAYDYDPLSETRSY